MLSDGDFKKAIDLIGNSSNVLITSHARPDGDACGSIVALAEAITTMGKKVTPLLLTGIPEWYEFLFEKKPAVLGEDVSKEQLLAGEFAQPDLIIIVDTNTNNQLPGFEEYLRQSEAAVLVLDHHVTSDGLGDAELVDSSAAACGLIVFELLKNSGLAITEKMAQAIFVAITTDTGWFQFPNTDGRAHRCCGELIDIGVEPAKIYHRLYQSYSVQRFRLMTAMLNNLELHFDGRYAEQYLSKSDFEKCGAKYSDTENLIDQCRKIGSVEAATLFVELENGQVKCSLRSGGTIDVRAIAQKFGGGGHTMASGTKVDGTLENAKKLIKEEIAKQLE